MSRIAYVNGRYVPHANACVHIEDRGYQFADGVYEVVQLRSGNLIDAGPHLTRLERSLHEMQIARPVSPAALMIIMRQIVERNHLRDGMIYLQVTRGVARRDHAFPAQARPALVVTGRAVNYERFEILARSGVRVICLPDLRWKRVDIKTTNLTANVLARQQARAAGAFEAWLVDDAGLVREGAATNAWIVTGQGVAVTRNLGTDILGGITRARLIGALGALNLKLEERPFSVAEAQAASEAFITGATLTVMPVVDIDGQPVGNGAPGPVATMLRARFHEFTASDQAAAR